MENQLIIALKEEIGNPNFFTGRKKEIDFILQWAENTKNEMSRSLAILARKKRGKTALAQRVYNLLYTKNDPQIIPFYIRIKEGKDHWLNFSDTFYRKMLSQYFGFKSRNKDLVSLTLPYEELRELAGHDLFLKWDIAQMEQILSAGNSAQAWAHAHEAGTRISTQKDERIIQIIDEFQFLNEFIYVDQTFKDKIELAPFYQLTGDSKVSPQIITGSYIGWLSEIIREMVARYNEFYLASFPDDEAIDAVYNYSNIHRKPVTEESAAYLAKLCQNDPYYISCMFESRFERADLTKIESIADIMSHETTYPKGSIARMWLEYIDSAFDEVNDRNAKKVVMYLAKHGDENKGRDEILRDLQLDMSDEELERKLRKLVRADIISPGSSRYYYRGLGDKVFEIVFRKIYETEIERVGERELEEEIHRQMLSMAKSLSRYRGVEAEYRVVNRFLFAAMRGIPLRDIVYHPLEGYELSRFLYVGKKSFHLDQVQRVEVDIFCESEEKEARDFIIEVKDWNSPVTPGRVKEFIEKKKLLASRLAKKTGFIFYSANPLPAELVRMLEAEGIMYTDDGRMQRG